MKKLVRGGRCLEFEQNWNDASSAFNQMTNSLHYVVATKGVPSVLFGVVFSYQRNATLFFVAANRRKMFFRES
jgi:hypothetical protein